MFSEAPAWLRHCMRFAMLPRLFASIDWNTCSRGRIGVLFDFLYSFFVLKNFPDNYGPCRLWERPRNEWALYFGSNYNPYQRARLRREVHPYHLEQGLRSKIVADALCRSMGLPVPIERAVLHKRENAERPLREAFARSGSTRLIIKPEFGHAGLGIAMAEQIDGQVVINTAGRKTKPKDFVVWERMVVQDVLVQSEVIARVADRSINTLRLLTMLTKDGQFVPIGASMRFGIGDAYIDNWSAGGVAVGVDMHSGTLKAHAFDKKGRSYASHPVSGVVFDGFLLPEWRDALILGERVQRAFPFFRILGMDIAFTRHGPVLIEINNDADTVFQEQTSGPLFASKVVWEAFRSYDLLISNKQKALYQNMVE